MRPKTFYITTPPYHVNDKPHLGHAYTALAADVLARHLRAKDLPVHLQTGTDEHGAAIEKAALQRGAAPRAWRDAVSGEFRGLWKTLNANYDRFIRTTDPAHEACVQAVFEKLRKTGDIYQGAYDGYYCPSCEAFYGGPELPGGKCPVHGRPAERVMEEAYLFRLSRYAQPLLEHYAKHPDFLSPRRSAQELADSVRSGLADIPVSRAGAAWGVPLESDPAHAVCAWLDALLAYASGAGYLPGQDSAEFRSLWPADVHLAGREAFRSHGVLWPAVLMALGLELPRTVYAHGWWTINGEKMSRSRGNFIKAEDVVRDYGVDALRYFLLREVPFGQDGEFSAEAMRKRYNSDLAGDLGNLFSRVMKLAGWLEHRLPHKPERAEVFADISSWTPEIHRAVEELRFSEALERIWQAVARLNRLVDEKRPLELARKDPAAMKDFLNEMVWCLRLVAGWLDPFMPDTASKMHLQLGVGIAASGAERQEVAPLFHRKQDERPGHPQLN
ncbi:MAG: class I tRNA ligase family protein [Elusimicrobiales bacterium]